MATVVFVTDPMCSWCWGMTPAIEATIDAVSGVVFDLRLGGINLDSTRAVGAYGRVQLDKLWNQVAEVTGQRFSHHLPEGTIYNSLLPCLAVEAMREIVDAPPFGFTHRLQQRFFEMGENINDLDVLLATAAEFEADTDRVRGLMDSESVRERTRWGFENARRYGTNALPSVLAGEDDSDFHLLAGGYVDAPQLIDDITGWQNAAS